MPEQQRPHRGRTRERGDRFDTGRAGDISRPEDISRPGDVPSTTQLIHDLTELVPRLIREELALAVTELREKGRSARRGAGLFSAGGVLALYGGAAVGAAAVLGLAESVPGWLAALIVGVVLLAVAGVLAMLARRQIARAVPPAPEQAIENVREDLATVKEAATGGTSAHPG
jgi:hypothetical protein